MEKQRQTNNVINKLEREDGSFATTNHEIVKEIKAFYKDLYSSRQTGECDYSFINNLDIPVLNNEDQKFCDEVISLKECETVTQKMKLDKSPGLDGIPIEFYKTFWLILGPFLVKLYNESYQNEKLSNSQRIAVISLIHKKGNKNLLKNYRPISLTNVDYHILGQVIANRLHSVLPSLISLDQAGYVKGRFIGNNIRTIEDLLFYNNDANKDSITCFLDFQKAYDSIEWKCIFTVLKKFNFSNIFIKWIKTLYFCPKITIKNNGWMTDYIDITRSVRQGCSLSALLFILVIEVLAIHIKKDKSIEGIPIHTLISYPTNFKKEIKILQYADDIVLTLSNENSLKNCLSIIATFSKIAGPVLNVNKSEIIGTGKYKHIPEICNIKTTQIANCLGIYVGHDKNLCEKKNWYEKIEKMESILNAWSKRNLTLFGSVTIIKSLAISKIVFSVQNTYMPPDITLKIEKVLYSFLWKNRERIKRKILIRKIKNGGINMLDVESFFKSLQCSWITRIVKNSNNLIGNSIIDNFGADKLLLKINNINISYINNIISPFYKQVFKSYLSTKSLDESPCLTVNEFLNQPLWGNNMFIIRRRKTNHPRYLSNWIKSGIIYVKDLVFDGTLLCEKHLHHCIRNKSNILIEILELKEALKPHAELIRQISPDFRPVDNKLYLKYLTWKSKFFYETLINDISESPKYNMLKNNFDDLQEHEINRTIYFKIQKMPEKKLAEFNYKIMHNILICGKYLSKWDDSINEKCEICENVHDIPHMLFGCKLAQYIWQLCEKALFCNFRKDQILLIDTDHQDVKAINYFTTIISYSLYKFWIECLHKNKKANEIEIRYFVLSEIRFRKLIHNDKAQIFELLNKVEKELI